MQERLVIGREVQPFPVQELRPDGFSGKTGTAKELEELQSSMFIHFLLFGT